MGKKARNPISIQKKALRKITKDRLPPPPPPVESELGSSKLLDQPSLAGAGFKVLDADGFDDGGVADLSLLIDLEDFVMRRRRGETEYFSAMQQDLLPRATKGSMAKLTRRDQKVQLAQLLFSEGQDGDDKGPSEVYVESVGEEDAETIKLRQDRVYQARGALRMSLMLREAACACLSLSELCKRELLLHGKAGATKALRCAEKALEIAGDGFWDMDDIAMEAEDAQVESKYEKNATTPGLSNPITLKLMSVRVSQLCKRSALLQCGNALAALGREEEARQRYSDVFPIIENEPRCARIDWERHSLYVNIGNSYSRQGDFDKADAEFKIAERIGNDHVQGGNTQDGKSMILCAKKARAFALKRSGKVDEAKALLKDVVQQQIADAAEEEKLKAETEAAATAQAQ